MVTRTLCAAAAAFFFTPTLWRLRITHSPPSTTRKVWSWVSGMVTKFEWINPHALLYLDGKDAEGRAGSWKFEMGSPGSLESRGWKRTDLKMGDQIAVDGYPAKDGTNLANVRTVTLPDGGKLFGGFQSTPGNPFK